MPFQVTIDGVLEGGPVMTGLLLQRLSEARMPGQEIQMLLHKINGEWHIHVSLLSFERPEVVRMRISDLNIRELAVSGIDWREEQDGTDPSQSSAT